MHDSQDDLAICPAEREHASQREKDRAEHDDFFIEELALAASADPRVMDYHDAEESHQCHRITDGPRPAHDVTEELAFRKLRWVTVSTLHPQRVRDAVIKPSHHRMPLGPLIPVATIPLVPDHRPLLTCPPIPVLGVANSWTNYEHILGTGTAAMLIMMTVLCPPELSASVVAIAVELGALLF